MKKFVTAILLISTLVILNGCSSAGSPASWGTTSVSLTSIAGTTGVAPGTAFKYTFGSAVTPSTVTTTSFFIVPTPTANIAAPFSSSKAAFDISADCDVDNAVAATVYPVTLNPNDYILKPTSDLNQGTGYTACITTGVQYAAGGSFAGYSAAFTTSGSGTPDAPANLTATAGSTLLTITWDAVSTAASYNLYWSTTEGVTKETGTQIEGATSPYSHTGLVNGTTYYYVATAVANTESDDSTEASGTPAFAGELDTSFGTDGVVSQTYANPPETPETYQAIELDSEGNIYVFNPYAMFKFDSTGAIDTTFGTDGVVDFDTDTYSLFGMVRDSDGNLVVSGTVEIDEVSYQTICRYDSDGTLDSTFGSSGCSAYETAGGNGRRLVQDSNGKYIVVGSSDFGGDGEGMTLWRYDSTGTLDSTFGSSGIAVYEVASSGLGTDLVLDSDGNIITCGYQVVDGGEYASVWKYSSSGTLDSTFGTNSGRTSYSTYKSACYGIILDSDENILITGYTKTDGSNQEMAAWKLNSLGAFDTTFGDSGAYSYSTVTIGNGLVLENGGLLIVVGYYQGEGSDLNLLIWALDPLTGTLDTDFFTDGIYTYETAATAGAQPVIDSFGRVVAGGYIVSGQWPELLMRFK